MRIALVSRELSPLVGGGIGHFVTAVASLLSRTAEVTIVTTAGLGGTYERAYARLRAAGDPRLPVDGVRVVFVPEPSLEEAQGWYHVLHCYSARVLDALREAYGRRGPDVLEFADYLGEGFVTLEAAWAMDPFLADTRVCVRLHTSTEIVEVLNGFVDTAFSTRVVHDLERATLVRADRVIWQGGDVLGTYERFYGKGALAPPVRIRQPLLDPPAVGGAPRSLASGGLTVMSPASDGEVMRLLYAGRLERRKGVLELAAAAVGLDRQDFALTIVGGDTDSGPLGSSLRVELEATVAGDRRIRLADPVDRRALARMMASHDVIVVPSAWECWPYVALEAMQAGRPVLATPVGGLTEMVAAGESGWLASGTDAPSLAAALAAVLDRREETAGMAASGAPAARARALCDAGEITAAYEGLVGVPVRRALPGRRAVGGGVAPLVSAVIPYFQASEFVAETVESLLAQTYRRLEVILVVDGSFDDEDWVVARLAGRLPLVVVCQMNRGLGAARNFGISQSRGRYVFPLDADNVAAPEFVARCVDVLEGSPDLVYVTSWSQYLDPGGRVRTEGDVGYEPLGNQAAVVTDENVAGDAAAVIRRRVFDQGFSYSEELTSLEDWHFYRELARVGRYGLVIPERLLGYRVREDSLQARVVAPHRERLRGEIEARIRESEVQWTPSSVA